MHLLLSVLVLIPYAFTLCVSLFRRSCSLLLLPAIMPMSSVKSRLHVGFLPMQREVWWLLRVHHNMFSKKMLKCTDKKGLHWQTPNIVWKKSSNWLLESTELIELLCSASVTWIRLSSNVESHESIVCHSPLYQICQWDFKCIKVSEVVKEKKRCFSSRI